MGKLTSQEARELANNFLSIAQSVGDFRYKNYDNLSSAQNKKMTDLHWSILNYADDLYTLSAVIIMDDVKNSLKAVETVTKKMQATYKKLEDIQKAIDIAAKVVVLGASILSENPAAIASSIQALVTTIAS